MDSEPQWFRGPEGAVFTMAPNAAFTEKYIKSLVDSGEWQRIDAPGEPEPEPVPAPEPTAAPAPAKRGPGRPRKNAS